MEAQPGVGLGGCLLIGLAGSILIVLILLV